MKDTDQQQFWKSDFGKEYTDRNRYNPDELDRFYEKTWGVSRSVMNEEFLSGRALDTVLEVGANIGNQLAMLQKQGYGKRFYGIEIQRDAVEQAKSFTKNIDIIQGSAFDLPFKDGYFDLVFTSGVLIHISPDDIRLAVDEMVRTTKRYLWGFEYFADEYAVIEYRGNTDRLWKAPFSKLIAAWHPELTLIKEKKFPYIADKNVDIMYLFEKK